MDSYDLLREILQIKDQQFLTTDPINNIVRKAGILKVEDKIYFLREFKELVRNIPEKAYNNIDTRLPLINTIQEALDAAIDEEYE